jgi:mRNA interferase MazF
VTNNKFDLWNTIKKKIGSSQPFVLTNFPKEREVWMCSIGKNVGYEQDGMGEQFIRPVFVVKKFNNRMFWIVPLSSRQKSIDFYYNFTDPSLNKVSAILAQLRLLSINRFGRKLYDMPNSLTREICSKLRTLIPSS